jgi:hypothetical protein
MLYVEDSQYRLGILWPRGTAESTIFFPLRVKFVGNRERHQIRSKGVEYSDIIGVHVPGGLQSMGFKITTAHTIQLFTQPQYVVIVYH